jgi:CRISPR-associated protein Csy1
MTSAAERSHAHLVRAAEAKRRGDAALQHAEISRALAADPANAFAYFAQAELAEAAGDMASARAALQRAVALQPAFAGAWQRLGILLGEGGDASGALEAFAHVVAIEPANARAFNNLGNALRALGRADDARAAFRRAVDLDPNYALAIANLALVMWDNGDLDAAEATARRALAANPPRTQRRRILVLLAGLLRERGAVDAAEPLYAEAIELAPAEGAREWLNLGRIGVERNEVGRAREAFRRTHVLDRRELRGAFGAALALPMIYADAAALRGARGAYANGLAALERDIERLVYGLNADQVLDGLRWTNFLLAYQGCDDRDLQARYAELVGRALEIAAPEWRQPMPERPVAATAPASGSPLASGWRAGSSRVRVGFASAFFRDGTAGRYFRSWVTDLPRERFEVFVYHLHPGADSLTEEVRARADMFRAFSGAGARPSVVAPAIRADALDVLVYPELGMDHVSFALAALRLAPRQLAGWGHPVTTGHRTIDAFVSCDAMEPANAAAHYVEPLSTLPGIGTRYRALAIPDAGTRAKFGLPDDVPLFLCPQSLFKIHPDNDALLAAVLAANPNAQLVIFEGRHPKVTAAFNERLQRALDAHCVAPARLVVLPSLSHEDFLRVNLLCDAMLDTLHWSGGNTSLDALACGLPVVTLPGAFMRGRQSAAMLGIVGAHELIARDVDDYVAIASRLVGDRVWRDDLAARIRAGAPLLFDRPEPVAAFAELLAGASGR